MQEFLEENSFLRDLNGEGGVDEGGGSGREDGGRGLGGLENIVAIAFRDDSESCTLVDALTAATVVPGLSAHWATIDPQNTTHIIPLEEQELYRGDFIGLKRLNKASRLHRLFCPGQHMDLGGEGGCGDRLVRKWVGWAA